MDSFNLSRFLIAQETNYEQALREIRAGRKVGHWMWFIFPQMRGLGTSYNSTFYGISSREEAEAYMRHPILGHRLIEISKALLAHADKPIEQILGHTDSLKLKSCLELFGRIPNVDPVLVQVMRAFYQA